MRRRPAAREGKLVVARSSGATQGPAAAGFDEQLEQARAHERASDFQVALDAYGRLARLDPTRREPLQGLRRLYAERGSWDAVLQVAELEMGLLADSEEKARLLTQMARIWERELGDVDQAQQLLARARSERSRSARPPAEATARDDTSTPTLVQRAWLASARGDTQRAVAALHDALARDASDVEALDMLLTVLEGAERYAEMSDLLERRATLATDDATRSVVLARLGALRETQQGDLAGARLAYERALEADRGNRAARSALQRLYRRAAAWPALRTLLESAAESGTPADRAAAQAALGALLEQQLDDPRAAEAAYEKAVQLAPEDTEALEGLRRLRERESGVPAPRASSRRVKAIAQLERMMESGAPSHEPPATDVPPAARTADSGGRVATLREELRHAGPGRELALQVALVDLLGTQDPAQALPHARRAAALSPRDGHLLERALAAALAAGGAFAVLDLLDDLIASAPDLSVRARLLAQRGDTLCDQLGWKDEAAHAWREALEADPRHAGARARLSSSPQA
jgi:tetratricopeptide (TPR) repeat protein